MSLFTNGAVFYGGPPHCKLTTVVGDTLKFVCGWKQCEEFQGRRDLISKEGHLSPNGTIHNANERFITQKNIK